MIISAVCSEVRDPADSRETPRIRSIVCSRLYRVGRLSSVIRSVWVYDRYGIVLIIDEVMTGFGRTGTWFFAESEGVVPDLLTFARPDPSTLPPRSRPDRSA